MRDRQEQASVYIYVYPTQSAINVNVYIYGGVIYENCHACMRQTNKITRH